MNRGPLALGLNVGDRPGQSVKAGIPDAAEAKQEWSMKIIRTFPSIEQVQQLPLQLTMSVPPDWEDRNGHVNVQYYQALYELGGYQVLEDVDITDAYLQENNFGLFDLEHHLHYLAELMAGDVVCTYNRILSMNTKRFHGMYFILNESREYLACTLEYVTAGVNLGLRRSAPFPPELNRALQLQLERHKQLDWQAPVCGHLQV